MRWIGFICISFQFSLSSCQTFYLLGGRGKRINKEFCGCIRRTEPSPQVQGRLIGPVAKSDGPGHRSCCSGYTLGRAVNTLREPVSPPGGIWEGGCMGWVRRHGALSAPLGLTFIVSISGLDHFPFEFAFF